ncbi:MAG: YkvA family protein [Thermomicrobiales bacterium]
MGRLKVGGFDFGMIDRLRLGWRLLRDPRVPALPKWLAPAFMVLYVVSPLDAIPDFIPILGQLDDVGVIARGLGALPMLVGWWPRENVAEHAAARGLAPEVGEAARATYDDRRVRRSRRPGEPIEATYWVDDWR